MTTHSIIELRDILDYEPSTGLFRWKVRKGRRGRVGAVAGGDKGGGYLRVFIDKQGYYLNRLAWALTYDRWPERLIDHINQDPSDNRIANLREATKSQNAFNSRSYQGNTSGVRGVNWHKVRRKWVARIVLNGKRLFIGEYPTKEEAARARRLMELLVVGEFMVPLPDVKPDV